MASGKVDPPFGPPDIEWKKSSADSLPEGVIVCGKYNGSDMYAGRTYYNGELVIGSVLKAGICTFGRNGEMHETTDYQIMSVPVGNPLIWKEVSPGNPFPKDVVFAGKLKNDECLVVGRIVKDDNTLVGWIDENYCLHVFEDGKEKTLTEYEALVHKHLRFLCICPPCHRPDPEEELE